MRRKMLLVAMALALVVSVVAVVQAQNGVGEFCSANSDFGVSHDACVTCLNPGNGNGATCLCKLIDDILGFPDPIFGAKNFGQCVKAAKAAGV